MNDEDIKKFLNKRVRVDYLSWGDFCFHIGILKRISKHSILLDNFKRINKEEIHTIKLCEQQ